MSCSTALAATTAKICDRSNSTARDVARVGYVFAPEVNILNMIHQNSLVKRSSPFLPLGLGGEQQDYSVFALYLIEAWLPSQNGLFRDAPHRQTVIRLRTSY